MMKLSRCLAAVVTTACFVASPGVGLAGDLGGNPDAEGPSAVAAEEAREVEAGAEEAAPEEAEPTPEPAVGELEAEGPSGSLELTPPTLRYGDQGPERGRGSRMGDAGIALTVLGGVSLVGSTFWLMVCPSSPEQVTVGQGQFEDTYSIKCFDAQTKVTDRFRQSNGATGPDTQVTLKSGAGNPVLPAMITMAAAGGVMLGTGIALLVLSSRKDKQGMAAAPMLNGSTAGLSLSGKF